jgi:hypothetical protein
MNSQELIGKCRQRFEELALKEYDWVSFYNGWLEGRMDLITNVEELESILKKLLNETKSSK